MVALVGQAGAEDVTETLPETARTCDEGCRRGCERPAGSAAARL